MALFLLGVIVFVGLLLAIPLVSNAPALTRALDRAHGVAYPGPAVPERFAAALAAAKDQGPGLETGGSPVSAAGVLIDGLTGRAGPGGSTLSQQLARILYGPGRSGTLARAEVVLLGIKLGLSYPAAKILQMYADVAYFGHGYYGLAAASCGYFAVPPARLSWAQAAVLADLVLAPSAAGPSSAQARAAEARVLARLTATGRLSQAQAAQAYRQPLYITNRSAAHGRAAKCPRAVG